MAELTYICIFISILQAFRPCIVHGAFLEPVAKTWWAKFITEDIYTAGRLTDRQIKYIGEDGFASIASMFVFDTAVVGYGERYPSTNEEQQLATQDANLQFDVILSHFDWKNKATYTRFTEVYDKLPKPILFHCSLTYTSTFFALLHAVEEHKSRLAPSNADPVAGQMEFYRRSEVSGHDFARDTTLRRLVADVLNEAIMCNPLLPDIVVTDWYNNYRKLKPVYKNYFVTGQIQTSHVKKMALTGIDTVINVRKGLVTDGVPSQEEVTLLNVEDNTGTYTGQGRQSQEQLEQNRIDPEKRNNYISPTSVFNYEQRNVLEFGDNVGYNEIQEQTTLNQDSHGFGYYHTPIETYNLELWNRYDETWLSPDESNPVLFHCRTGSRAVAVAMLTVAYKYGKSSDWAIKRAALMGYSALEADVTDMWRSVLDNRNKPDEQNMDNVTLQDDPLCAKTSLLTGDFIVLILCAACLKIISDY